MRRQEGSLVGTRYRLESRLASGGMGSVWVGRHVQLDTPVAIKFMDRKTEQASLGRERFAREAKAAAGFRSPHVVQIIDYDADGEEPYIVMELLHGEDLGQRLQRCGRLPLPQLAGVVSQLVKGLSLAHSAGIVHRDLKPSNIFLARVGAEEIVKILDFGVAKETRLDDPEHQTTTGVIVGSPSYMSPEQARGATVDARSDIWSLGVLVFQALTGKRPFEGNNLGDTLVRICSDPIPRATDVFPALPKAVDAFFERALCRSPDGRFGDAYAFAAALESLAASEPNPAEHWVAEGGASPRDEATGSVVAQAASASLTHATTRQWEGSKLGQGSDLATLSTTVNTAHRQRAGRPVLIGSLLAGGAALIALTWYGSQSRWFEGPAVPRPVTHAPASLGQTNEGKRAEANELKPAAEVERVAEPKPIVADVGPALAPTTTPTARSTTQSLAPTGPRTRPSVVVSARPAPQPESFDPKFGLKRSP